MIRSFTITNHLGNSVFLDIRKPESTGFLVSSVTGLGPVKAEISMSDISMFDGSIYAGSRLGSRNIVFNLVYFENNNEKLTVEQIRHRCYDIFPLKKEIKIVVTNDKGNFAIRGRVESNEIPIFSNAEGSQVSILCPDPYFEREETADTLHYISAVVPNFSFPVSFEAVLKGLPPEEQQPGLGYMTDSEGNVYYEYMGPYEATSRAANAYLLPTAFKFSQHDITVNRIPYTEEVNSTGGTTVKIGGTNE